LPEITCELSQSKVNNCGAYALLAVAMAFKVLPPERDVILSHHGRESIIEKEKPLERVADSIYRITGNLGTSGGYLTKNEDGYNSPSSLSYVASQLGLNVKLYGLKDSVKELSQYYPSELSRCRNESSPLYISESFYSAPSDGEANLLCVANSNEALHWISQGSDHLYYDPGDGIHSHQWKTPRVQGNLIGPYRWKGIWMNFQKA
jgi:hypothetical protein